MRPGKIRGVGGLAAGVERTGMSGGAEHSPLARVPHFRRPCYTCPLSPNVSAPLLRVSHRLVCQPLQSSAFPKRCSSPCRPPLQITGTFRGCSRPPEAKATSFAKHVSGRSLSGPVTHVSSTCVVCAAKPSASLLPLSLCSCCSLCLGLLTLNEHLLLLQNPFQKLTSRSHT